jgi:hypothetical protein
MKGERYCGLLFIFLPTIKMEKRNSPAKSQKAKNRLKNLAIAVPLAVALTFSSCDSNPTTVPELKAKWENVK